MRRRRSRTTSPPDRRRLILIVEDILDARELYAEYLRYEGFDVITAISGREAVRLAGVVRPDLILMDIRLPVMDGLTATAELKADAELAHIPIVAIAADPSLEMNARARKAGCVAFIAKPALPDEVARQITEILSAAGAPQRGAGS